MFITFDIEEGDANVTICLLCVCVQGNSESCGRILTKFAGLIEPSRKRLDLHAHGPKQKG